MISYLPPRLATVMPKDDDDRDYNPEQEQYDYDRLEMEQFENDLYEHTEGMDYES
jgi:hypothetical protein